MAFISWQAWLFTTWALSQDSYVWTHSLSPWNITFSFVFLPNSLWELNYLDWYGRVEWKWHFVSGDHIWILTSPYNNSIYLSNLLTSLILTFLTGKKNCWSYFILWVLHLVWGYRNMMLWLKTVCKPLFFMVLFLVLSLDKEVFLDNSKLKRDILSRSMRVTCSEYSGLILSVTLCWICCRL